MGRSSHNTDANGWTWFFRKNNVQSAKPINNPFYKDLDKVASSFYVTNFPESINAKDLWNTFVSHGRLVDAFIANKRSKGGKRFGFIRFMGVIDTTDFVRSLSNIWIGSFHVYVDVAKYQRSNSNRPDLTNNNVNNGVENRKPKTTTPINTTLPNDKQSFASVVRGSSKSINEPPLPSKTRSISLNDQDLISIDDSSKVLLVKLKEVESMSNMYKI